MQPLQKTLNMMIIGAFAGLAVVASESDARAEDVTLLCAGAMRSTMQELVPEFQKASGHDVKVDYANIGTITERVRSGDEADLAIVSPQQWESLQKDGKISAGTRVVIGKVGIGVSVKKGVARPDIGSVDAIKRALMNARSIAVGDPNQGSPAGAYLIRLLDRLGIGGDIKPKLRLVPPGPGNIIADAVVKDGAEFGVDQMTLIIASPDVDLVGPLPADIQNFTTFTAAIPTSTKHAAAAKALIEFLTSPHSISVFKSKGYEAG